MSGDKRLELIASSFWQAGVPGPEQNGLQVMGCGETIVSVTGRTLRGEGGNQPEDEKGFLKLREACA